jgi:hypothetical protein
MEVLNTVSNVLRLVTSGTVLGFSLQYVPDCLSYHNSLTGISSSDIALQILSFAATNFGGKEGKEIATFFNLFLHGFDFGYIFILLTILAQYSLTSVQLSLIITAALFQAINCITSMISAWSLNKSWNDENEINIFHVVMLAQFFLFVTAWVVVGVAGAEVNSPHTSLPPLSNFNLTCSLLNKN